MIRTKYIIIYALDAIPTTLGGRTAGTMRRTATITTITTIRRRGRPIRRDTITTVPETLRPSVATTTAIRSTPPPPDSSSNNSNHRACQSRSTMSSSGTSGGMDQGEQLTWIQKAAPLSPCFAFRTRTSGTVNTCSLFRLISPIFSLEE